ncbi:MAG: SEC-C domain-containing protein [Myxococcales bacterium]|nr:SEC-C domain-containing protein [Myxococcales bacterium]
MNSGPTKTAIAAVGQELDAGLDADRAIEAALAEGLPIRGAAVALARYVRGGRTPSRLLAPVLRWVDPACLGPLLACGEVEDRVATALRLVADDEIVGPAACGLLVLCALLEQEAAESERALLRAWVRTYCRARHPVEDGRLLAVAAKLLELPAAVEIMDPRWAVDEPTHASIVESHRKLLLPAAIDALPADETETVGEAFTVRRVVDKVGRNDVCPCGSGKKYKKCCAEKDAAREKNPSLRAGFTRDELLREGASELGPKEIGALPQHDLPRIDRARLTTKALAALQGRALELAAWDLVALSTGELLAREDLSPKDRARALDAAASGLLSRGRFAQLRAALEAGKLGIDALMPADALSLALSERPADALDRVEAYALASLRDDENHSDLEIPHVLRRDYPALAILLARGTLDPQRAEDSTAMLELIEEVRDRLGVRPFDPATELYEVQVEAQKAFDREQRALGRAEREAQRAKEEVDALRRKIDDSLRRTTAAEQRLREQELALRAASEEATDDDERRRLRAKVEELKTLVAEGNEERRAMRAEVDRAQKSPRAERAKEPEKAEVVEAKEEGDAASRPRGVQVPVFGKDVERFLRDAPPRVAHDALVAIAELAAGDELRWGEVKQLARPNVVAYSGRIGIHYRVIFRLEPGRLLVDEIVHRKDLEAAVRRAMGG